MFGKNRKPSDDATPPKAADPSEHAMSLRDAVFTRLKARVGTSLAADMRADFDEHVDDDPVDGVETAWMCLSMKLIEAVDRLNDSVTGRSPGSTASEAEAAESGGSITPFTVYRKNA